MPPPEFLLILIDRLCQIFFPLYQLFCCIPVLSFLWGFYHPALESTLCFKSVIQIELFILSSLINIQYIQNASCKHTIFPKRTSVSCSLKVNVWRIIKTEKIATITSTSCGCFLLSCYFIPFSCNHPLVHAMAHQQQPQNCPIIDLHFSDCERSKCINEFYIFDGEPKYKTIIFILIKNTLFLRLSWSSKVIVLQFNLLLTYSIWWPCPVGFPLECPLKGYIHYLEFK